MTIACPEVTGIGETDINVSVPAHFTAQRERENGRGEGSGELRFPPE